MSILYRILISTYNSSTLYQSLSFRLFQCRFIRTSIYRTDKEFIDPDLPLLAVPVDTFLHSDDGYFVNPVVERSCSGMAMVLLNLDRKSSDGGHGALESTRLEKQWSGETLKRRLRKVKRYDSIGVRLQDKEKCFGIKINEKVNRTNRMKSEYKQEGSSADCIDGNEFTQLSNVDGLNCLSPTQQMMSNYYRTTPIDMRGINLLYTKLRNNEVNSFRRVVVLSSLRRSAFAQGLNIKDLLLIAECSQIVKQLQPYGYHLLRNFADLCWLLCTYMKPLIGYCPGTMRNEGASFCLLTNHSAVYHNTELIIDPTISGMIPSGGISFILAQLPSGLGIYLVLTGHRLTGSDLIDYGLAKYWIAPEAMTFLEITSESQMEVSEYDAASLIREHFLQPPKQETNFLTICLPFIAQTFGQAVTLQDCVEKLNEMACSHTQEIAKAWATDCLSRMHQRSLLAQTMTFELFRRLHFFRHKLFNKVNISNEDWIRLKKTDRLQPATVQTISEKRLVEAIDEQTLEYSIQLEMRAMSRLLMIPETLERLRLSACQPWRFSNLNPDLRRKNLNQWIWGLNPQYKKFEDISQQFIEDLLSPFSENYAMFDFVSISRTPIALSSHPWVKTVHPDYNRKTGLDHDPMTDRANRWKPDFLDNTRKTLIRMLSNPRDRLLHDRVRRHI